MSGKLVLIVEDNYDFRYVYGIYLRSAGYRVAEALDGQQGVTLAQELLPDLILMDLSMPGLDGWSAIEQLRADRRTAEIPVFILSGTELVSDDLHRIQDAGVSDYLLKPCRPTDLMKKVDSFLGQVDGRSTVAPP